jgi:hypothetical protein
MNMLMPRITVAKTEEYRQSISTASGAGKKEIPHNIQAEHLSS